VLPARENFGVGNFFVFRALGYLSINIRIFMKKKSSKAPDHSCPIPREILPLVRVEVAHINFKEKYETAENLGGFFFWP
jgi:hypothetical protein